MNTRHYLLSRPTLAASVATSLVAGALMMVDVQVSAQVGITPWSCDSGATPFISRKADGQVQTIIGTPSLSGDGDTYTDVTEPKEGLINSTALDPTTGYMWGITERSGTDTPAGQLVLINPNGGGLRSYGTVSGFDYEALDAVNGSINGGTFDNQGNYWVVSSQTGTIYKVDVSDINALEASGPTAVPLTNQSQPAKTADLAYSNGYLWGGRNWNTQKIVRIDVNTGEVVEIPFPAFSNSPNNSDRSLTKGAAWTNGDGSLGMMVGNGTVYRIDVNNVDQPVLVSQQNSTGLAASAFDATSCLYRAPLPTTALPTATSTVFSTTSVITESSMSVVTNPVSTTATTGTLQPVTDTTTTVVPVTSTVPETTVSVVTSSVSVTDTAPAVTTTTGTVVNTSTEVSTNPVSTTATTGTLQPVTALTTTVIPSTVVVPVTTTGTNLVNSTITTTAVESTNVVSTQTVDSVTTLSSTITGTQTVTLTQPTTSSVTVVATASEATTVSVEETATATATTSVTDTQVGYTTLTETSTNTVATTSTNATTLTNTTTSTTVVAVDAAAAGIFGERFDMGLGAMIMGSVALLGLFALPGPWADFFRSFTLGSSGPVAATTTIEHVSTQVPGPAHSNGRG